MDDILSHGKDREPRWRWPRWRWWRLAVVAGCVTVALVVAFVWYLPGLRHHGGQAKPSALGSSLATQDDGSDAGPDPLTTTPALMTGAPLARGANLQLLLGGQTPAWLQVPSGRTEPVRGLSGDGDGYQFVRLAGGWVVQPSAPAADLGACQNCASAPQPTYYLANGSPEASRIGTADLIAPAAAPGAVWLVSYQAGADMATAAGTAREASVTGAALGPRYTLPAGYVIDRGTRAGLLLVQETGAGTFHYELWDPGTGRVTRSFVDVIAASPAQIAWAPACTDSCLVQVLDLSGGRTSAISLPAQSTTGLGAFSPDGQLLALQLMTGHTAGGYPAASRLVVATVASGQIAAVPGTTVGSGIGLDFGWQPGSHLLVADVAADAAGHVAADAQGQPEWQIAVWRPGDARLSTALTQTPVQSWPVIG